MLYNCGANVLLSVQQLRRIVMSCLFLLSQAQEYITAGACLALGLRFAGSANSDAFECLYDFAKTFMKIMSFAGTSDAVSVLHLIAKNKMFAYVLLQKKNLA